ncbi:MAG: hypothetical protein ACRD3V_20225 [Vicinamibacteria bacterium]
MSKTFTVEFGPSRSAGFPRAVAEARRLADEFSEPEPGRYRARFALEKDARAYAALAAVIGRVRGWRASEVLEEEEAVSAYHAGEMAWCAASQLRSYGTCRFRYVDGVFPRCAYCPLFDAERAIRDVLGENPPPPVALEIQLGPTLRTLLRGEPPPAEPEAALEADVPDFLPEEWEEPPPHDPQD